MQLPLTHNTIGELGDGSAGAVIDAALREVARDLEDRGQDRKPRKVEIVITFKQMEGGQVVTIVEANARIPRRKTPETVGKMGRKTGRLGMESTVEFQQYCPEDPRQRTMDEVDRG